MSLSRFGAAVLLALWLVPGQPTVAEDKVVSLQDYTQVCEPEVEVRQIGDHAWEEMHPRGFTSLVSAEGGPFEARLDCPGYLSHPVEIQRGGGSLDSIRFSLVPAGTVVGQLLVPENADLPTRIELEFERADLGGSSSDSKVGEDLECPLEKNQWTCSIPTGSVDIKLTAPGYAQLYFWGLDLAHRETLDVGARALVPAASVVGWVHLGPGLPDFRQIEVELRPHVRGWLGDPRERRRESFQRRYAGLDEEGFFRVDSVSAGAYLLTLITSGYSPQSLEINLEEGEQLELRDPLRLVPAAGLDLFVEPQVDPTGGPWTCRLSQERRSTNRVEVVVEQQASVNGTWSVRPLDSGSYRLEIIDGSGAVWHVEGVVVEPEDLPRTIEVSVVPVEGVVLAGGEPQNVGVVFGTTARRPSITLWTDRDGEFQGFLPRDGLWEVELLLISDNERDEEQKICQSNIEGTGQVIDPVQVDVGPAGIARIEIELPDTHVRGRVVRDNEPVPRAIINVLRVSSTHKLSRSAGLQSDEAGDFELVGIPPGFLQLRAETADGRSPWQSTLVQEGVDGPEIVLEIKDRVPIRGRVVAAGNPVLGAQVSCLAVQIGSPPLLEERTTTGADGRFAMEIEADAQAIDILALAPGRPAVIRRIPLPGAIESEVVISMDGGQGAILILPEPDSYIHHAGAALPLDSLLLPKFYTGSRVETAPDGLLLRGFAPGQYWHCSDFLRRSCVSGLLEAGGVLDLTDRE